MRSQRLSPLIRPRSVGTRIKETCDDNGYDFETKSGAPSSIQELNLDQLQTFDLDLFNPLEFKKFTNLNAFPYAFTNQHDAFRWAFALLSDSPVAFALTNIMRNYGWQFALTDLGTGGYHIDLDNDILEIDNHGLEASFLGQSSHYRKIFLMTLVKGLRDLWHEMESDNVFENYKPESILMLERARAADIDSLAILIAWELRSANHNGLWRYILSSDAGDMAQILTNVMDRYPTALYNGVALAHVFRQWYADIERIDGCDHSTLEQIDFIIDNFEHVSNQTATKEDFETLSTLPDGSFYLKELGDTVARDPFFNGLNDPINQAHLFQIIYDSQVTYVGDVPFRDSKLAKKFL